MYHACVRTVRSSATIFLLLFPLGALGCEKPRERACRSLVIQAKNAEVARTAVAPDARVAAHRAQSAARWVRSNAVEDRDLIADRDALADALEHLADARLRLASATEVLGAADAPDLLARAERVSAYVAASDRVLAIAIKPCPWNVGDSLIDDPRCARYDARELCPPFDAQLTFAEHAEACLRVAETLPELARVPGDAIELRDAIRGHALWARTLPARPAKETVDRARALAHTFEDRGRADAEVVASIHALETKCAP